MSNAKQKHFTIGELAQQAGVGVETIRFYERKGLIEQPLKPMGGFRAYPDDAVTRLTFIHEAQQLGFTLKEIRDLLTLRDIPETDVAAVRGRATAKLAQLEDKILQFQRMRVTLQDLLSTCPGTGALDECPIVDALSAPLTVPLTAPIPASNKRHATIGRKLPVKTINLSIEGMHCDGCAKTVEALLSAEAGIKAATASYSSKSARVLFDPDAIDAAQVMKVVARAGYRVQEATSCQ